MNEESYNELREIEDRLYDILTENGGVCNNELGEAWSIIYDYLHNATNKDED